MTLIDKAEALLPCPFCGGEAVAVLREDYSGSAYAAAECTDCVAKIAIPYSSMADGAEELRQVKVAWNRRADLPARGVQDARDAVEELANMQLGIPLEDWARLSARILAALSTAPVEAQARETVLREAAGVANDYAESCAGNVIVYSPPMTGANEQLRLLHEGGEVVARQISAAILELIGERK